MKATITVKKEVDIIKMSVSANVRYWEDSMIGGNDAPVGGKDFPCKIGDYWCPKIDIETGKIDNWNAGISASIHFKVCDQCSIALFDKDDNSVFSVDDEYVPKILCPKENGYGDYIIMDVNSFGLIENWKKLDILKIFDEE